MNRIALIIVAVMLMTSAVLVVTSNAMTSGVTVEPEENHPAEGPVLAWHFVLVPTAIEHANRLVDLAQSAGFTYYSTFQ